MNPSLRAALGAVLLVLLVLPGSALAANTVVWSNYDDSTIGRAPVAGGSGSNVFTAGGNVNTPNGTTVDPSTGTVYWVNSAETTGGIYAGKLDGTGTPTLVTNDNVVWAWGLTLDPRTKTLYWMNDPDDSLHYVKSDGTDRGVLYSQGGLSGQMNDPVSPALDPAHNRIYWTNYGDGTVGYANLDGSGSPGLITLSGGCTVPTTGYSVNVDPDAGRLYVTGTTSGGAVSAVANLNGSNCATLPGSLAPNGVDGLAADLDAGKLIGTFYQGQAAGQGIQAWDLANLAASPTVVNIGAATTANSTFPAVVAAPKGTAALTPTRVNTGGQLTCSASWDRGVPGMQFYRAPATTSYSWTRDGQPIAGATSATLTASAPGSYTCTATATNFAGSGSATSSAATVNAAVSRVIWSGYNYGSIGIAPAGGGTGADLYTGGGVVAYPDGTTADPETGKVYWANYSYPATGAIYSGNLDGTGSPTLVSDQAVISAWGLTLDPTTKTLYWASETDKNIRYVKTNGSGGGVLYSQSGLPEMNRPVGPAIDPAGNKIYWANYGDGTIGYANLDGSGAADKITLKGTCTVPDSAYSVAVDPVGAKLYVSGAVNTPDRPTGAVADLDGSNCTDLPGISAWADVNYGFAADPDAGRFISAVYGATDGDGRLLSWNLSSPSTAPATLDVAPADTRFAVFPVVVSAPKGTATLTPTSAQTGAQLTCAVSWDSGTPGMQSYRAPATATSYRWTRNGQSLAGATSATLVTTAPGSYACTTTASNFAGSGSETSSAATVSAPPDTPGDNGGGGGDGGDGGTPPPPPSTTTLTVRAKAIKTARRGSRVKLVITTANSGAIAAKSVTTCVKLGKGFSARKQRAVTVRKGVACWRTATLAKAASVRKTLTLKAAKKRGKVLFTVSAQASNAPKVTNSFKTTVR